MTISARLWKIVYALELLPLAIAFLFAPTYSFAAETATLSGIVRDPSDAAIANAEIVLSEQSTGTQRHTATNTAGLFTATSLQPGVYSISIGAKGFKTLESTQIHLGVAETKQLDFTMEVGAVTQAVSVDGNSGAIETAGAAVGTVVDRRFVENIPLNGRSFQALLALTPGVVLTPASATESGQLSVNGQRANANYFTVDGVSANAGISAYSSLYQSAGGSLPSLTALGGTSSLVSLDAMQEFRVQTSTYAPEYGRTPGAQVSIVTRSGANTLNGTAFDYIRNNVLDANNWFANRAGLSKPEERQNDFGGVFGGPVLKNRVFFFLSYEGLRLRQPLTQITSVPSAASRQAAPVSLQPYLNAFPQPNATSLSNGFAQFAASYSNPSTADAYSARIDDNITSRLIVFGRYSYSPSQTTQRSTSVSSDVTEAPFNTQAFTAGLTAVLTPAVNNETRFNFTLSHAGVTNVIDTFGGATPLSTVALFPAPYTPSNASLIFDITGAGSYTTGLSNVSSQAQYNVIDALSVVRGRHHFKFGVDWRRLLPSTNPYAYSQFVLFSGMTGATSALSGVSQEAIVYSAKPAQLAVGNYSSYAQDAWRATGRLTLTYGIRWDINPPIAGRNTNSTLYTVQDLANPATLSLAAAGTPLYKTSLGNIAPRIGVAYLLKRAAGWELVLRSGAGVFYDTGAGYLGAATQGFPFSATSVKTNVPFPLSPQQASPPVITAVPPVSLLYVAIPNLQLPRTEQWNVSFEQALGVNQTLSVTYLGALGQNLLRQDTLYKPNASFSQVSVTRNTAASEYNALQAKFQRRVSSNLQILASYTFSHSIDNASNDSATTNASSAIASAGLDRGDSDFDVRHSMTAGFSYQFAALPRRALASALLANWGLDGFITARSALPDNLTGSVSFVASTEFTPRPNVVPGQPLYLFGPSYPGGKGFNSAAFSPATIGQQGTLGRNVLRGFGAAQVDASVHRDFHLAERLTLQVRVDGFNIFNHANFGNPVSSLTSALFGQSTNTLASSLGAGGPAGGLSPLYQLGGPRSLQLSMRLRF